LPRKGGEKRKPKLLDVPKRRKRGQKRKGWLLFEGSEKRKRQLIWRRYESNENEKKRQRGAEHSDRRPLLWLHPQRRPGDREPSQSTPHPRLLLDRRHRRLLDTCLPVKGRQKQRLHLYRERQAADGGSENDSRRPQTVDQGHLEGSHLLSLTKMVSRQSTGLVKRRQEVHIGLPVLGTDDLLILHHVLTVKLAWIRHLAAKKRICSFMYVVS
jgi:hypothetical protein